MNPDTQNPAPSDAPLTSSSTVLSSTTMQAPSSFTRPEDPSEFIRTYAKDMAQLTNSPAPASILSSPKVEAPATAPESAMDKKERTEAAQQGVAFSEPYPMSGSGHAITPPSRDEENVVLSSSDSDGIFTAKPEPKTEEATEREAALARIREKLAKERLVPPLSQESAPMAAITPPQPPQPEIVPAAPIFTAPVAEPVSPLPPLYREPIPPPAAIEIPPPAPEPLPTPVLAPEPVAIPTEPQADGPSPIHTFSSDFADRIDEQKSSTFAVLAAQSDAGQTPKSVSRPRRTFIPLLAGIGMLVIGIGAIAGAYFFTRTNNQAPMVAGVPSLVAFDDSLELHGTGPELLQALSDASQGSTASGDLVVTYITTSDATTGATGTPQPGGVLFRALTLPVPDILLRNINDSSTIGYIRAGSESRPFFVLSVNSYERTFAGMLAWERTLPDDLETIYPAYSDPLPQMASSTDGMASSTVTTPPMLPNFATEPVFTDDVVDNYDVRVLRDASGRSLMLYGYRGKDTLIIARDEAAFTALVARLSASGH